MVHRLVDTPIYKEIVQFERDYPNSSIPAELAHRLHEQIQELEQQGEEGMSDSELEFDDQELTSKHSFDLSTRVALLESQQRQSERQQWEFRREVKADLRQFKEIVDTLKETVIFKFDENNRILTAHVVQENKDRVKLLLLMITSLISSVVAMAMWAAPYFFEHMLSGIKVTP